MFNGVSPGSIPNYGYALSVSGAGRQTLPVARSAYLYSHFEHVQGTPAPDGGRGVSISKLKLLNTLIENLRQLQSQGGKATAMGAPVSDEHIDAMIDNYKNQIAQAKAAAQAMPYLPSPAAASGAVFSLTA